MSDEEPSQPAAAFSVFTGLLCFQLVTNQCPPHLLAVVTTVPYSQRLQQPIYPPQNAPQSASVGAQGRKTRTQASPARVFGQSHSLAGSYSRRSSSLPANSASAASNWRCTVSASDWVQAAGVANFALYSQRLGSSTDDNSSFAPHSNTTCKQSIVCMADQMHAREVPRLTKH